ncbi:hypothetical protein EJ08DRAFT_644867 [Tothia fuscella]|uniref:Uncharacterized protein n=1 Tax=Tothia fuscella TaxID=1048955 RepID=A0A9P4P342_9PEZI|nr:hypothetical protein EJ08DRAFT_644867 [Tothia fuscella]
MTASEIYDTTTLRPQTSEVTLSSITSTSVQSPQHNRRASVRRVVTKAFSTRNNKKKRAAVTSQGGTDDSGHLSSKTQSNSNTLIRSSESLTDTLPNLRDSTINIRNGLWFDACSPHTPPDLFTSKLSSPLPLWAEHFGKRDSEGCSLQQVTPLANREHARPYKGPYLTPIRSHNHSPIQSSRSTSASTEISPGVLRLRLVIQPRVDMADAFSEEIVWVAVHIHGELSHHEPSKPEGIFSPMIPVEEPDLVDDCESQATLFEQGDHSDWPATPCVPSLCCKHRSTSLGDVIARCAAPSGAGVITDISVSFQARPDGLIQTISGDMECPILRLGQSISLMVKVKLKSLAPLPSHGQTRKSSYLFGFCMVYGYCCLWFLLQKGLMRVIAARTGPFLFLQVSYTHL